MGLMSCKKCLSDYNWDLNEAYKHYSDYKWDGRLINVKC